MPLSFSALYRANAQPPRRHTDDQPGLSQAEQAQKVSCLRPTFGILRKIPTRPAVDPSRYPPTHFPKSSTSGAASPFNLRHYSSAQGAQTTISSFSGLSPFGSKFSALSREIGYWVLSTISHFLVAAVENEGSLGTMESGMEHGSFSIPQGRQRPASLEQLEQEIFEKSSCRHLLYFRCFVGGLNVPIYSESPYNTLRKSEETFHVLLHI